MPSPAWYLQRLKAISLAEIPWRAWRIVRARVGRYRRWPTARDLPLGSVWSGDCSAEALRRQTLLFPPAPDDAVLADWPAEWRDSVVAEAEDLLSHRASFFALERTPLGDRIDWNRDYASGRSVPTDYAATLDYRDPLRVGDVKYIWELGRMQHLTRLGQAWRLTHDGRFAQEIVEQIGGWIEQCPQMTGVHWTSPMEAGLRLISWTWAFHLIRDWQGIDDEFCGLLIRSVDQHLLFIDRNYSLFSSANNHLIAEACGAFFAASYWRGLKCSDRCGRRARKHLIRECRRQNFADGVNKEQAFGYQFFVWDLLLISALMARNQGDDFPTEYWDRLQRMAEFLAWVSDCNGNTPNVGDQDGGLAVDLGGERERPAIGMISTAAVLWQRGDFRQSTGGEWDEKTAWLLGMHLPNELGAAPRPAQFRGGRSFSDGGYHVLRHGDLPAEEILLVFDAGPLGWPATAAHAHADALSMLLHVAGRPVLIDPGTYSYQDTAKRHYYKATAQHNTLCFGTHDQAEYLNRFIWGKRPRVDLLQANLTASCPVLEGRVVWWNGSSHRRKLVVDPQSCRIEIEDSWNWDGPGPVAINFCIAPGLAVSRVSGGVVIRTERFRITIQNGSLEGELSDAAVSPRCYFEETAQRWRFISTQPSGRATTQISWDFT